MSTKVIQFEETKREKINEKAVNKSNTNQNLEINLGHIGFNISMFQNSNAGFNISQDTEFTNIIHFTPDKSSDADFSGILKITPKIDVNNKIMSKNLFISFCKFIKTSLPNVIQLKEEYRDNLIQTKRIQKRLKTEKSNKFPLGYIGFDLFLYTEESKIFLKPTIDLDNDFNMPDYLFFAYCEKIKENLPNLLNNFIQICETEK